MRRNRSDNSDHAITRRVISTIKQLMGEGVLRPGSRLPTEREFARILGVSRSSLRQALKVLEIMGVISQRVRHGTFLESGASMVLSEPMDFLILMDGISFHEVVEARLIVEPELAALAAIRSTSENLARIKDGVQGMEKYKNTNERLIEQDLLFHRAIFEAAGNRLCTLMFSVLHNSFHELISVTSKMVALKRTVQFHKRIYAAIERKDPMEARQRMREHLEDVKGLLIRMNEDQTRHHLHERISAYAQEWHNKTKSPRDFPS